jgi:signal transduction histidine kinase
MRIAIRLWLSMLATFVLVLGIGLVVRVEEERALLVETTLRDRRFFGHALHTALSREHGSVDPLREAESLIGREEVAAAHIVARLVSPSRAAMERPLLPGVAEALVQGEVAVGVRGDEILTYVPIDRGPDVVAIELAEPHAVPGLLRRIGWLSLLFQTLALATAAALVTGVLVRALIGRPLGRLAELARRIAAGDLSARAPVEGRDEVALLAGEMNEMAAGLEGARRKLEESEAERTQALEQLRHADRLRTVGQLASQLAHELGTPLNVVSGHARLVADDEGASDETKASARTILEQTAKMTKSIRGVLDFSRRRSDRRVLDVVELAEGAQVTLAPLARKARAQVVVERQGTVARVRANAQELLQVLTNLLVNAFQAMPEGGLVRVQISERDATPPDGSNAVPGRHVVVAIVDQGHGIAAEDMPHLFEAFFTQKAEGEGTGLGLAVVDGIVRDHRGWIEVRSALGEGTTFEVFLPRA